MVLEDASPAVLSNSIAAMLEMSAKTGTNFLQLDEGRINKLLTALNECTEWGQVFILDALATYEAPNVRAAENILERLRTWSTTEPHSVLKLILSVNLKINLRGGKRI